MKNEVYENDKYQVTIKEAPYYSVNSSGLPDISSKTVGMVKSLFEQKIVKKVVFMWKTAEKYWKDQSLIVPPDVEIYYGNNKPPYTICRFDESIISKND